MQKLLTPLELKVMNHLWMLEKAFVKDLLESWDEVPKPAYNTISTILKILHKKEFVQYNVYGRTYEYYPVVDKNEYQETFIGNAIENVFSDNLNSLMSAMVKNRDMSQEEIKQLQALLDKHK